MICTKLQVYGASFFTKELLVRYTILNNNPQLFDTNIIFLLLFFQFTCGCLFVHNQETTIIPAIFITSQLGRTFVKNLTHNPVAHGIITTQRCDHRSTKQARTRRRRSHPVPPKYMIITILIFRQLPTPGDH